MEKNKLIISILSLSTVLLLKSPAFSDENHYVVSQGDTLYSISRKTNIPVNELIEINSIKNNSIALGQRLSLKKGVLKKAYESPSKLSVVVSKGDTLYSISRQNNISFSDLVSINNIESPYSIDLGQVIYLSPKKQINARQNSIKSPKKDIKNALKDFISPLDGSIVSYFSTDENNEKNYGINIVGKEGDFIKASRDGIVSYSGSKLKGFGNTVILSHKNGYKTVYSHNKSNLVMKGEIIKQGEKIATVGKTGKVDIPQVHFEIRQSGKAINPLDVMKK